MTTHELIARFLRALAAPSSERPVVVPLVEGKRIDQKTIRFATPNTSSSLTTFVRRPARLHLPHQAPIDCQIVEVGDDTITLETKAVVQQAHLSHARLQIGRHRFSEQLRQRLTELDARADECTLAARVFDPEATPIPLSAPLTPELQPTFNQAQQHAYERACRESLLYIWGPPGTGKTTVISAILATAVRQGKRALICSTTNAAVDHALAQTHAHLSAEHLDAILRIGKPSAEMRETISPLTYHAKIERLAGPLRKELEALHAERLELEATLGAIETKQELVRQRATLLRTRNHLETRLALLDAELTLARSTFMNGEAELARLQQSFLARFFSAWKRDCLLIEQARRKLALAGLERERQQVQAKLHAVQHALDTLPQQDVRSMTEHVENKRARLAVVLERIRVITHRLRHLNEEILSRASLIGATLMAAATNRLITDRSFDLVLVDEASMASLPQLFAALCLTNSQIILVGDFLQLPPIAGRERADSCLTCSIYQWNGIKQADHPLVAPLSLQYRMHPSIASLSGHLYRQRGLPYATAPGVEEQVRSLTDFAPFPGSSLVWLDTSTFGETIVTRDASHSPSNRCHAALALDLIEQFPARDRASIAIMSPYRAQVVLVRTMLEAASLPASVRVGTIHQFQGQQADLVIIDTTVTSRLERSFLCRETAGFSAETLLNVAVTRARAKVIVIGSASSVRHLSPETFLRTCLFHIERFGIIVDAEPMILAAPARLAKAS